MSAVKGAGGGAFRFLWLAAGAAALAVAAACLVQDTSAQTTRRADPNAATQPADPNAATKPALVTQDQFMKVMKQSCVRCHRAQCASVDALKKAKWLIPGKPDSSPAYTIINPRVNYHKLSAADTQIVHDFIEQAK